MMPASVDPLSGRIRETLAELYPDLLVADGFDDAILGVVEGCGRATVVCYDYAKCVEGVHHPVPSDDVLDAWLFVAGHEEEFGVAPGQLHFGGASAGAHLVAGVTKRLRDGAGPLPASPFGSSTSPGRSTGT